MFINNDPVHACVFLMIQTRYSVFKYPNTKVSKYPTEQLRLMMMDEREDGRTGGRATGHGHGFSLFPLSSFLFLIFSPSL
jgi:hypothetical protein